MRKKRGREVTGEGGERQATLQLGKDRIKEKNKLEKDISVQCV